MYQKLGTQSRRNGRQWAVQSALSDSHLHQQLENRAVNSMISLGVSHCNGLDSYLGAKSFLTQLPFNCCPTQSSYMFSGFQQHARAPDKHSIRKLLREYLIPSAHLTQTINLNIDQSTNISNSKMGFFSFKKSSQNTASSEPLTGGRKKKGRSKSPGGRRSKSPAAGGRQRSKSPAAKQGLTITRRAVPRQVSVPRKRMGRTFCGCCDMRIATCVLNISHMIVALITEIIEALKWGNRNYLKEPPVLLFLGILISCVGLSGAIRFSKNTLLASSGLFTILCFFYAGEMDYAALGIALAVFFAQLYLADEIHRGIMTPETYEQEEYIDDSGKAVYLTVREKAVEIGEAAAEINRKKEEEKRARRAAEKEAEEQAKMESGQLEL